MVLRDPYLLTGVSFVSQLMAVGPVRGPVTTHRASHDPAHSFRTEARPIRTHSSRAISHLRRPGPHHPSPKHAFGRGTGMRKAYRLHANAAMLSQPHQRDTSARDSVIICALPGAHGHVCCPPCRLCMQDNSKLGAHQLTSCRATSSSRCRCTPGCRSKRT